MSSGAPVAAICPLCEQPIPAGQQTCPRCPVSAEWLDRLEAHDFVVRRFEQWQKEGHLNPRQFQEIADVYRVERQRMVQAARDGQTVPAGGLPAPQRCWSCEAWAETPEEYCLDCGAPLQKPAVRSLRYLTLLEEEIGKQVRAARLSLAQVHELRADTRQRQAALRGRLEKERIPLVTETAVPSRAARARRGDAPVEEAPAAPRRSLLEIVLDPRSIQWLLGLGGALLVIGLVIWLATVGLFDNALFIACVLGAVNAAVLAGGWAVILKTRYQTAGRALTLLACLVMPLNLWFYHAYDLIALDGHLWVPALVICALYAASALVLRDQLFVYVLMGGVTLTGLLILADMHKFWEIAAPSGLMMLLALIAIHAERAFPDTEGPFSRRRFGLAFFWCGQALLAGSLLLLLGAQLAGWLYKPVFEALDVARPAVVTDSALQWLAIGLVLLGTYAYLYSDLVVRRIGVYVYLAVFTLLWAEVLLIQKLDLNLEWVIIVLALTGLAANVGQAAVGRDTFLARTGPPVGLVLCSLPVLCGVLLHVRATNALVHEVWPYQIGWAYVGGMLITAISCRVAAHLHRHTLPWLSTMYFFGTAAATLAGAAALLAVLGVPTWNQQAPLLMLIPIAYVIASRLYRGHSAEDPLVWVGHTATGFMILGVLGASLDITPQVFELATGKQSNLLLALFCAEAAVFYVLAAVFRKEGVSVYLATAMACGAVWQLLVFFRVEPEYYTLVFAVLGLALLIVYRLGVLEQYNRAALAGAAFQSANTLMSLAFVASVIVAISRLVGETARGQLVGLLAALAVLSLLAAWLVRHQHWRVWYIIMAVVEVMLTLVTLEVLVNLSFWQKVEIFCVAAGLILLVLGHLGWYREQVPDMARQNELVSFGLLLGSLLTGLPLMIAVLIHRGQGRFSVPDELGMLVVGLVLLASGVVFQLKSTTLTGAVLLAVYLLSLLLFIHRIPRIQTAALWIALGGGAVFLTGLLLSIYRDRLLTLPEKIKRREGVFRVLGWR